MNPLQFCGLTAVYLCCLGFVLALTWQAFRRERFNFHIFFSLLFLLTFYFGFPLTGVMVFGFNAPVESTQYLLQALLSATLFYGLYSLSYKIRLRRHGPTVVKDRLRMNQTEAQILAGLLALIAVGTVAVFFIHNGFLLFRLSSYSQIFSSRVSDVALKRFFYFFIPAMLVVYFYALTVKTGGCFWSVR